MNKRRPQSHGAGGALISTVRLFAMSVAIAVLLGAATMPNINAGSSGTVRRFELTPRMEQTLRDQRSTHRGGPGCMAACQRDLAQCLQQAGGDPVAQAQCQDNYDACGVACID